MWFVPLPQVFQFNRPGFREFLVICWHKYERPVQGRPGPGWGLGSSTCVRSALHSPPPWACLPMAHPPLCPKMPPTCQSNMVNTSPLSRGSVEAGSSLFGPAQLPIPAHLPLGVVQTCLTAHLRHSGWCK